jgi:hypothetical protein
VAMTRAKAGVIIIGDRRPRAQHQYCDSQRRRNSRRIRIISGPWSGASLPADQHGQPGVDVLESRAMEGGRRAASQRVGYMFEGAGRRASLHADQHGQPGVDVLESRAMEGGGRAGSASDGDEEEGAGTGASLHADQHGQSGVHLEIPGTR